MAQSDFKSVVTREFQALCMAFGLLTRIPVPDQHNADPLSAGRALHWYPLVGLAIGLLLLAVASQSLPAILLAPLVIALWVALTGALHLDGLADCADAWVGGMGDRERTLRIMKDPACGPIGVVALIMVLALKIAALACLPPGGAVSGWWLAPLVARALLPLAFASTPYVRSNGMGTALATHQDRGAIAISAALSLALCALVLPVSVAIAWLVAGALLFVFWRRAMNARLGGFTGDGAGALVELTELLLLLIAAVLVP